MAMTKMMAYLLLPLGNNIVYAPKGLATIFIKNNASLNDFDNNIWFVIHVQLLSELENARNHTIFSAFHTELFVFNPYQGY